MSYIPEELRQQVVERARRCCEYCQAQRDIILRLDVDHIVPLSGGGKTELDNLCLACKSCNGHKHQAQTVTDPETGDEVPLYNPRVQAWIEHFAWNEDNTTLIGRTPTGRATIARLKINDIEFVKVRQRWVAAGWHPPKWFLENTL